MNTLREILKEIYEVDDKYLVHLNDDILAPYVDHLDDVGTYIGYDIMSKKAYSRAYAQDDIIAIPLKVYFRVAFIGKQAEEFAESTLFWDDRVDVTRAFEKYAAQVNYDPKEIKSYHVHYGGMNDQESWVVDMSCQTTYQQQMKHEKWNFNIYTQEDDLWFPQAVSNRSADGILLRT